MFRDQLNNTIHLDAQPKRIVSLVPSQTELLSDLGLTDEVVGITKFCVHPAHWRKQKTIVGGTKNFNLDIIDSLNPDLIIGNKEENFEQGIASLRNRYPVWMSDIYNLSDALGMIQSIGEITDTSTKATQIITQISTAFSSIRKINPQKKVLYIIWKNPWMAAGGNTFINSMLQTMGLVNCLDKSTRYPELTFEAIQGLNPDFILLSTEPFPFKQHHVLELERLLPKTKTMLVDGEMFSWYGSRLAKAPDYFKAMAF